jgi:TolB-like protein/Flp pilus assembly protein TadD
MQAVWPEIFVTEDSLTQCIADIRRALGGDGHKIVETFPKRGYRLNADPLDAADPSAVGHEHVNARFSQRGWLLVVIVFAAIFLLAIGPRAILWRGMNSATGVPYVAVLPFTAIPSGPQPERLARGLTEDIITDLARFPEFKVIARHSIAEFGAAADPVSAAEKLAASFVVTGSIQMADGRARIAAQLIDRASGNSLWSERWDRPSGDIFAIQTEISEQIANRLGGGGGVVEVTGRIAAHRKSPSSLSAYDLYLLGTERLEQISQEDVKEAIRLLKRAIELDPGLARAWVELAHAYRVMADLGSDPEENYRLFSEAAMKAIELDPGDPEAQIVEGKRHVDVNNLAEAKFRFNRALQMAPNQWEIVVFYLVFASRTGEAERGAAMVDEAIRLNPNYPMWAARMFAYAYFMAGRNSEALFMLERLDEENLGPFFWPLKAGTLAASGRREEAKHAVERALQAFPHMTVEGVANDPNMGEDERRRLTDTMRLVGFPLCAKPGSLARFAKPLRFKECAGRN